MVWPHLIEYPEMSSSEWWASHQRQYLLAFAASGFIAFVLYVLASILFQDVLSPDEGEITLVTLAVQAIGFGLIILIARLCYQLGPIAEDHFEPADLNRFRRTAYLLGFWFSCALPFLAPLSTVYMALVHPYHYKGPI